MTLLTELQKFIPMANMLMPRRTMLPVLKTVCFRGDDLIASDLEHFVVASRATKGDYLIPVKTLADILKNKPEALSIREKEAKGFNLLKIAFDGITATIPKGHPDEFPSIPSGDYEMLGLWTKDFVRMLEQQAPFASADELKPSLLGVFIKVKDGVIESCATNGHFLRRVQNWPVYNHENITCIITTKTIKFLAKFMGNIPVLVERSGDRLRFTLDNGVEFHSRLIAEKYPDYESVFPTEHKGYAVFGRDEMLKALRSLKQFCNQTTYRIAIGITAGKAALTAEDVETASRVLGSAPLTESDGEIVIRYNIRYLIKSLASVGKTVRWEWKTPVSAATFVDPGRDDVTALLMPIRLND